MKWTHLIRFECGSGSVWLGDAIMPEGVSDVTGAVKARTIAGDPFGDYSWGPTKSIKRLLSPLGPDQVHTVRCLGLNYRKHAAEASLPEPKFPILITKPSTALAGPRDPILVPPMAQAAGAVDYEVELVVVIGKAATSVSVEEASDYISGYAVGNDVSQREWQLNRGGSQWNVSKMFNGWAPFGPAIVAPSALPKPLSELRLCTLVNGQVRQSELAGDMIFSPAAAVSFLSQGATLLPGDLIFLGTPAGVGMGFKPPKWLRDGDTVEVAIEGIGSLINNVHWSESPAALDLRPTSQPRGWFGRL